MPVRPSKRGERAFTEDTCGRGERFWADLHVPLPRGRQVGKVYRLHVEGSSAYTPPSTSKSLLDSGLQEKGVCGGCFRNDGLQVVKLYEEKPGLKRAGRGGIEVIEGFREVLPLVNPFSNQSVLEVFF